MAKRANRTIRRILTTLSITCIYIYIYVYIRGEMIRKIDLESDYFPFKLERAKRVKEIGGCVVPADRI